MQPFDFHPRTRVVFRDGGLSLIGELAQSLGMARTLIVADPGMQGAGLVDRVAASLQAAAIVTCGFHQFDVNPDSAMVEAGRRVAAEAAVDSIVALGGGSSLDCAKGINFILTNGGSMRDYRGYGKAVKPMLPMIGIPTTAGTGSDAQSYAIISDPATHEKMACGDPGAAFRIALLDPSVTITQPRRVSATAGYDAISHAVESFVTARRTSMSDMFALSAWRLLHANYEQVLEHPSDVNARGGMLIGAHEAGAAIEQSMLGATHACANPLTARYGTTHGDAIAIMLPHVVRWNSVAVGERYAELLRSVGADGGENPGDALALRLEALRHAGGLPSSLREAGVLRDNLETLASDAAKQWTGTFNPRPFDAAAALELYERAF
jgi:alcohol dehydrogenase